MSKVIIDVKSYAVKNNLKMVDLSKEHGVSTVTLSNWRNEAPDVVKGIYFAMEQQPEIDLLKVLNGWQKPPYVLAFIRDFMIQNKCSFTELVSLEY
jgi:hypothetical protein